MQPPAPRLRLHRRQFVIGRDAVCPYDDWRTVDLGSGIVLSHDPALPVSRDGERVLLGIALPDAGGSSDDWAGRWVLVEHGRVRVDATGTLAVFHRVLGDGVWASSSPELLRALPPALPLPRRPLVQGHGMDWYPPPASGIDGISCLLPSQALRLDTGAVEAEPLLPPVARRSEEATLDRLAERLVSALRALAGRPGGVSLPLTAGRDSRLVLAAATAAGVPVRTYTFEHPTIPRADREIPPRLAAAVGVEHRYLRAGPRDSALLALWDRHTAGHAVETEREYLARGQLEAVDAAVDLGGSVFELGRGYYHAALPAQAAGTPEQLAAMLERELPSARPDGVLQWARWVEQTPADGLDWRDRFYLEQRLAGWLGAIEQGADLLGVTRLHVANGAAYLAETLALPEALRRRGDHQAALVQRLAPALADFPVNPPGGLSERVASRARRELIELRAQPTARAYAAHRLRRLAARRAAGGTH